MKVKFLYSKNKVDLFKKLLTNMRKFKFSIFQVSIASHHCILQVVQIQITLTQLKLMTIRE